MSDVEFLETNAAAASGDGVDATLTNDAAPVAARTPEFFAAVAALSAAAVLQIAAPFLTIFTITVPGNNYEYASDGWGRFKTANAADGSQLGHFTRFGIATVACGIAFALLVVAVQVVGFRPRSLLRALPVVSGLTIAVCGVAGGIIFAAGLQLDAVVDSTNAALKNSSPPIPGLSAREVSLSLGGGAWLALAALAIEVLAVLALRWLRVAWTEPKTDAVAGHTTVDGAAASAEKTISADPFVFTHLPADLPIPDDDGAAAHLTRRTIPKVVLTSTSGRLVALDKLPTGRTILFVYPMTGRPGVDLPGGWDEIPGARGCTTEVSGFRDLHSDLHDAGAATVLGLSAQDVEQQREAVERLRLTYEMLSDPDFVLVDVLDLPTFDADGEVYYRRLTLVITDGAIEHVFYPIFPPDQHADEVLRWLRANPPLTW